MADYSKGHETKIKRKPPIVHLSPDRTITGHI